MNPVPTTPSFLKKGDKVALISTARKVSFEEIEPAMNVLESWGLKVEAGSHLFAADNQFAGTDAERLYDLQHVLDDPEVKCIFCARGGYGTTRIVDKINWIKFLKYPKWIVGFSDVTVLLNKAAAAGVVSLHAPMPLFFNRIDYAASVSELRNFLFGKKYQITAATLPGNRPGKAMGNAAGGNLSLIVNSIGTSTAFDPAGKILFIEDIDEYLYHIDRMMLQLKRAGILSTIAGLVAGHFTDMKDNLVPFGSNAYEIIQSHVAEYSYPVCYHFPFGHAPQNIPVPIGQNCILIVEDNNVHLEFC